MINQACSSTFARARSTGAQRGKRSRPRIFVDAFADGAYSFVVWRIPGAERVNGLIRGQNDADALFDGISDAA